MLQACLLVLGLAGAGPIVVAYGASIPDDSPPVADNDIRFPDSQVPPEQWDGGLVVAERPGVPVETTPALDPSGFKLDQYSDPMNLLDLFEKAVTTRNYMLGAAALLMLLVFIIKKRWKDLPPELVPFVVAIIAVVPGLCLTLMRPNADKAMIWKQVAMIILMTLGSWEAIGKWVMDKWIPRVVANVRARWFTPATAAAGGASGQPVPIPVQKDIMAPPAPGADQPK